jgi:hypothetical protein
MNRRQDERLIIVETVIHRVYCLNRRELLQPLLPSLEERFRVRAFDRIDRGVQAPKFIYGGKP